MDLRFTDEERAFRETVRAFIAHALPASIRAKLEGGRHASKDDLVTWTRILNAKGWAVTHWPVEWGGKELDADRTDADLVARRCSWPRSRSRLTFNAKHGRAGYRRPSALQELKERFLPPTANLDDLVVSGLLRARKRAPTLPVAADHRTPRRRSPTIVNGQKTWTTLGQYADWIFCAGPHRSRMPSRSRPGISFLLIEMNDSGS